MAYAPNQKGRELSLRNRLLLLGVVIAVLFWVFESVISSVVFHEGSITAQLLTPDSHEVWQRMLALLFILGFSFYANHLLNKHKRAEDALRTSEGKYRALVELFPDVIAIQCDEEIVFMNPAGVKIFSAAGYDQAAGKALWDFVLPESRAIIAAKLRQVEAGGTAVSLLAQKFIRADGTLVGMDVTATPFIYKGKPAIQVVLRDVTLRTQAEEELIILREAVEASGEVIFMTDPTGLITYVNPGFTKLYGYTAGEVVGKTTPRILKSGMMPPENYDLFWKQILEKGIIKEEIVNRCKDGRLVTIENSANPIWDEDENVVGFLAIQQDITGRKRVEEQIRQRNKELAALNAVATTVNQSLALNQILNKALDEVLRLDVLGDTSNGVIFLLNEKSSAMSLAAHRGIPKIHPCLVNPPQIGECLCGLVVAGGKAIITSGVKDERHSRGWAEMPDHKDVCLPLMVRDKVLGVMNLQLPVTHNVADSDMKLLTAVADQISVAIENARLFEAVSQQRERLRALGVRLAEVEEAERQRLARELHDQVGQNLTALGINLNIVRSLLSADVPSAAGSRLDDSLGLVEETTEQIRNVMADLRPLMLDDYGLVAALRWYAERLATRTGLVVTVQGKEQIPQLTPMAENALFRIAQEALTNVTKHAQAMRVLVTVTADEETVRLVIADDGIGFDPARLAGVNGDRGWGLLNMAERAEALNGRCWIESDPKRGGTRVIAEVTP